jgi:hypothetical protein
MRSLAVLLTGARAFSLSATLTASPSSVLVPQRAPTWSQRLNVKRLGLTQLALVAQQKRQVVDGPQRARVLVPQRAPKCSQRLDVKRLGLTQLALVLQQNRQVVDGRKRVRAATASK